MNFLTFLFSTNAVVLLMASSVMYGLLITHKGSVRNIFFEKLRRLWWITSGYSVFIEKLIVIHLVNYGTRIFITILSISHHWNLKHLKLLNDFVSYFPSIHINILIPSTLRSPKWSPSLRLPV
jgi:hypothetical protein